MCKTPSHFSSQGRGSLAASWTRPGDPRSALDGPQHRLSCLRSARCSPSPRSQARGRGTTRSRRSARPRSSPPPLRSRRRARDAAAPAPRRAGRRGRRRRDGAHRLGGPLDRLVDRRRPVVGVAGPRARLPGVPRARPRGGGARVAAHAAWRRSSRSSSRRHSPGRCSASPSRRSSRTATAWRASASPSATGTPSRCSRTAVSRSVSGWAARRRLELRVWGLLLAYGAIIALLLTQSRAGIAGAVAVLVLWLAASDRRLADALRAVVAVLPGVAVAGWAFTRPALVEDGALRADRVTDGRTFALLALAGGVRRRARRLAAAVLTARRRARAPRARRPRRRVRRAARRRGRGGRRRGRQPRLVGVVAALGRGVRERPRAAHGSLRQQPPGLVAGVAPARRGQAPRGLGRGHVRDRPEARPRRRELGQRAAQRAAPAPRRPRRRRSRPRAPGDRRRDRGRPSRRPARAGARAARGGGARLPRPRLRRPLARGLRPRLPRGHRADARRARRPAGARPPAHDRAARLGERGDAARDRGGRGRRRRPAGALRA